MSVILQGNKGNFHFSMDVAMLVGIEGAVFLENMCFWIRTNSGNRRNFHENRYWSYNKLDAFVEIFPCWSRRQIERIINNLLKDGYLLSGNFNKNTYDRTMWYTLSDKGLKLFNIYYETQDLSISPNGEMEIPKRGNGFPQTVTAIPDNKPYNKTYIKSSCEKDQKKHKAVDNPKTKEDWKEENQKKPAWADGKKEPPRADVTKQSSSWNPEEQTKRSNSSPEAVKKAMMSLPIHLRPKKYRNANPDDNNTKTTEPPAGAEVQSEIPSRSLINGQGAAIDAEGYQTSPSRIRSSDGLLEARRIHSYLEEAGLAGAN